MADRKVIYDASAVAAVLAPCSSSKRKLPSAALQAGKLPPNNQSAIAKLWLQRLADARPGSLHAAELYCGASHRRVQAAAAALGAPLYVISAGLGLVRGDAAIPPYDLTLSPSATDSLATRVSGDFDPAAWWEAVQTGPFASPLSSLARQPGRILVALTRPYALLIGPALAKLPEDTRARLRLFGSGLRASLPDALYQNVIDYDSRLDRLVPGTRLDAPARALAHFAALLGSKPPTTPAADQALVGLALDGVDFAEKPSRPRLTDDEVRRHIAPMIQQGLSATAALKRLRTGMQVACEQGRFFRLYQDARA